MSDESPLIDVIIAAIKLAHRDARKPWLCDARERDRIQREAVEFLEWAQSEGEELREDIAHHIPKGRGGYRATRSWAMVASESTQEQIDNWKSNQRRRRAGRK